MIQTDFLWLASELKIKTVSPPEGRRLESPTGTYDLVHHLQGRSLGVSFIAPALQYSATTTAAAPGRAGKGGQGTTFHGRPLVKEENRCEVLVVLAMLIRNAGS